MTFQEVDVPVVSQQQCQLQLQQTRLGYDYKLHPGMICAGGEEGKDACKVTHSFSPNSILYILTYLLHEAESFLRS
jgi:hypothetical protein